MNRILVVPIRYSFYNGFVYSVFIGCTYLLGNFTIYLIRNLFNGYFIITVY